MRKPSLLLLPLLLLACGPTNHADEPEADEHDHGDEIIFTPEQAKAGGVQTTIVQPATFHEGIKTSGQVLGSIDDERSIVATMSGTVSFVSTALTEGATVRAGQTLFSISGEGFAEANALKANQEEYAAAKREYERGAQLAKDNIISDSELTALRLRMEQARLAIESKSMNAANGTMSVATPMAGMLKSLRVRPGEYVEKGTVMAVVTKNQKLWLRAEVSEKYYNHLNHISGANFRLTGSDQTLSIDSLGGRLVSYSHSTAEDVCFVPVIFEFDNRGDIVAGSFADVYLLGTTRHNIISLPLSAITEEQGLYYVYVKIDEEGYRKQPVEIGETDGLNREIVSGINPGDEVVTKGATLIKLASMSGAIPEGHSHNH